MTSPSQQDLKEEASTKGERTKSLKRASSVLLPAELNNLAHRKGFYLEIARDGRFVLTEAEENEDEETEDDEQLFFKTEDGLRCFLEKLSDYPIKR